MSDCIFCKIVEGKIPSTKVFENESVLAFKDIHPAREVHYLFIPKTHFTSMAHLKTNAAVMEQIFSAVFEVTQKEKLADAGYRTVINTGEGGGQEVMHLHVHILAGKKLRDKGP